MNAGLEGPARDALDGRIGLPAVGGSPAEAEQLYPRVKGLLNAAVVA